MLKLIALVVPLGLDTFAIAAALGMHGRQPRARLRASLVMTGFEMAMPVAGLLLGRGLGTALGDTADYAAIALLAAVGVWMLFEDDDEAGAAARFGTLSGLALVGLGLGISLDELAIGFTIGLLGLSIVAAVLLIGAQALLFAQVGARLGARIGEELREWAERAAGFALIALAVFLLVEKLR